MLVSPKPTEHGKDVLDLVEASARDVGRALEDLDELERLFERAGLTERERTLLVRHIARGEPLTAIAGTEEVSTTRVRQIIGAALGKLRAAAGIE